MNEARDVLPEDFANMTPYQARMLYGPEQDVSEEQTIDIPIGTPPEAVIKMVNMLPRRKQKKMLRQFGTR